MRRVWVVQVFYDYEGESLEGVYGSRARAAAAVDQRAQSILGKDYGDYREPIADEPERYDRSLGPGSHVMATPEDVH